MLSRNLGQNFSHRSFPGRSFSLPGIGNILLIGASGRRATMPSSSAGANVLGRSCAVSAARRSLISAVFRHLTKPICNPKGPNTAPSRLLVLQVTQSESIFLKAPTFLFFFGYTEQMGGVSFTKWGFQPAHPTNPAGPNIHVYVNVL